MPCLVYVADDYGRRFYMKKACLGNITTPIQKDARRFKDEKDAQWAINHYKHHMEPGGWVVGLEWTGA